MSAVEEENQVYHKRKEKKKTCSKDRDSTESLWASGLKDRAIFLMNRREGGLMGREQRVHSPRQEHLVS